MHVGTPLHPFEDAKGAAHLAPREPALQAQRGGAQRAGVARVPAQRRQRAPRRHRAPYSEPMHSLPPCTRPTAGCARDHEACDGPAAPAHAQARFGPIGEGRVEEVVERRLQHRVIA
jgi:hypothetical protein